MLFNEVVPRIIALSDDCDLNFPAKGVALFDELGDCTRQQLIDHLDHAGVIPECFGHDSSEEKLFAKYCDALLAHSLIALGIAAEVIVERADAADVIGNVDGYKVVGDAKAIRLSRTAKNQKDFKVEALDKWRKGADYACLISPLYQYPNTTSQIYLQAAQYNVTLLSYTHLAFLLNHPPASTKPLRRLWELGKQLGRTKDAQTYWDAVENVVLTITGCTSRDWNRAVEESYKVLPVIATEQISFWENEKRRIGTMRVEELRTELVRTMKIDSKIDVIRRNFVEAEASKETFET